MATHLKSNEAIPIPWAEGMRFGVLVSEWNSPITFALRDGALAALKKYGADSEDILVEYVPGTFELTLGAQIMAENLEIDAVLCLGCVIQGDTRHFDFICQGVTQGLTELNIQYNLPFVFGVLTTDNLEQAQDRAGGKLGNKGEEAAITAIKMVDLQKRLSADNI